MKAMNVYFDPNQGQYFKIDKQTGTVTRSHRNGADQIRFKAQYSGSNYNLRKQIQRDLSPSSLTRPPYQVKYQHKHTIPIQTNKRNHNKSSPKLQPMNTLRTSSYTQGSFNNNIDLFAAKMKDYSKIKDEIMLENHSPRTNIMGSLPSLQICKQYKNNDIFPMNSLMNSKKKNYTKSAAHMKSTETEFPTCLLPKNQLKKQRQIFRKYNFERSSPINNRNYQEMIERKKNLKILEKLNIDKNNRMTAHVYS